MRKLVQLLLVVTMFFSFSTFAYSASGLYIGGNIGLVFLDDSDVVDDGPPVDDMIVTADNGFSIGGFMGYAFENGYRVEGELVYQRNDFDEVKGSFNDDGPIDANISSVAVLANGYYDFKNKSRATPFLGGGLGFSFVDINTADDDDIVFVYHFTAGVGFEITEKITLDLKYRYVVTEDLDIDNTSVGYSSDILYTGIRFSF